MKLIPGPLLVPSLALGVGAMAIQAAAPSTDWAAILTAMGVVITAGTLGFVRVWKAIKSAQAEARLAAVAMLAEVKANTVITTQTRDMADGRLTDVTNQLAGSKEEVARLVDERMTTAAQGLLAEARDAGKAMMAEARAAAVEVLAEARKEAAMLLASAAERAPRRRRD